MAVPFPVNVPLVGQAFQIQSWCPTLLLICQCEAKQPILVPYGASIACAACRREFTFASMAGGEALQFGLQVTKPDGHSGSGAMVGLTS